MSKKININYLFHAAAFYLEKYDAGIEKVRRVLERKIRKNKKDFSALTEEENDLIRQTIQKLEENHFLNNQNYAQNCVRRLSLQGKSEKFIIGKLKQEKFSDTEIQTALESMDFSDEQRAIRLVKRKKLGYLRGEKKEQFYLKDMTALARAGFSYELSKKVLNTETEDF